MYLLFQINSILNQFMKYLIKHLSIISLLIMTKLRSLTNRMIEFYYHLHLTTTLLLFNSHLLFENDSFILFTVLFNLTIEWLGSFYIILNLKLMEFFDYFKFVFFEDEKEKESLNINLMKLTHKNLVFL